MVTYEELMSILCGWIQISIWNYSRSASVGCTLGDSSEARRGLLAVALCRQRPKPILSIARHQ